MLLGIVVTAVAGYCRGRRAGAAQRVVAPALHRRVQPGPIAFQLDIVGVLQLSFLPILLTLFLMSFLDTLGTLVGVGAAGGMLDEKGNFPGGEADARGCGVVHVQRGVGTSTSGAYIESAAGVREGARTGLAAVTTAAAVRASRCSSSRSCSRCNAWLRLRPGR